MAGRFANAPAVNTIVSKPGKPEAPRHLMEGLSDAALVSARITELEATLATLRNSLDEQAREYFVKAAGNGQRPVNFKAYEGDAEASIELRKRSTRSYLTADEVADFEKNGVPYETVVEKQAAWLLNPKYAADPAFMKQLEKDLDKAKLPLDLFTTQVGSIKQVVSDDSVKTVFAKGLAGELLDRVCILGVKYTKAPYASDVSKAFAQVVKIINGGIEAGRDVNRKALAEVAKA